MVGITILIFHMSIHCDKIFPRIPTNLTLWRWPWCLTYLSKKLKLDIYFEWYMLGFWYFSWVFLMTTPFYYYLKIWPCDLDFHVWPMYWKLKLGYIFWMVCARTSLFQLTVPCDKTFPWMPTGMILTMVFDLLIENFIFEYIFWMVWTGTLIFDISIPCTIVLTLWPWPWCLTYLLKTTTLTIFFEWHLLVGISFECFCDKTFLRVPKDLTLLSQFWCLTLLIEILTLATFLNGLYKNFYI
jgi:hypothetical protein